MFCFCTYVNSQDGMHSDKLGWVDGNDIQEHTEALSILVLRGVQNFTVRLMIYLQEVIAEDFCFLCSVGEKGQQQAHRLVKTEDVNTRTRS